MTAAGLMLKVTAVPVVLTALSWVLSGVVLGRLFPFAAGWLFFAAGGTLACAFARPGAWWYLSAAGGRHAGPVAFRAAARRRQRLIARAGAVTPDV
jgi:hypothetical protein